MENQTIINITFGSLLALILTFQIVGDINKEPTHYCEERQIKAFCYSLSSTNKTCYTQVSNGGAKLCNSLWKKIPQNLIIVKQWLCNTKECIPLK